MQYYTNLFQLSLLHWSWPLSLSLSNLCFSSSFILALSSPFFFSSSFSLFSFSFLSNPFKYSLLVSTLTNWGFLAPGAGTTRNSDKLLWILEHIADGDRTDTMCNCEEAVAKDSTVGTSASSLALSPDGIASPGLSLYGTNSPGHSADGDSAHYGPTKLSSSTLSRDVLKESSILTSGMAVWW